MTTVREIRLSIGLFIFLAVIVGEIFLVMASYRILTREPPQFPIAYQSIEVQLSDPVRHTQNMKLHLTLASFTFGAQSNITAFARMEPMPQDRIANTDANFTIPTKYFLWFEGSSCPTIPLDLYSPIPMCKIELDSYPQGKADWSNAYWQGTFSHFKDEHSYSTIGITYPAAGNYGIALSMDSNKLDTPFSEPLIKIADASVTQGFSAANDANQLGITNLAFSFIILIVAMIPIDIELFRFLRKRGAFDRYKYGGV